MIIVFMMKRILFVLGIVMMPLFFSCVDENNGDESDTMCSTQTWKGKQILFPENLIFTSYVTDTVDFQFLPSKYKVLVYADSSGCTSCKLQLNKWRKLIEYTDSVTGKEIPFLFFIHPKNKTEMKYLLRGYEFDIPICVDMEDKWKRLNHFCHSKSDSILHVFLLDKNNRVLVYGNPLDDGEIKRMFFKHITGEDYPIKSTLTTTAEIIQPELDFGSFDKAEVKKGLVGIKNAGNNPLFIVDVRTTCGCTVVTYDKCPVKRGDTLWIEIEKTPKNVGFFNEMVTIKFNSENNQPVKVRVKGRTQ